MVGEGIKVCCAVFYCCILLSDFLSTEEANIAGPSDLIMTRGNPDEEEEEEVDSDTDDIDHSGEKRNIHCKKNKNRIKLKIRLSFKINK